MDTLHFHLPTRPQFRCISGCVLLLVLAIAIPLLLLLAGTAVLPRLTAYLDRYNTQRLIDLDLHEIYALDTFDLQLTAIDPQLDGTIHITVDQVVSGLSLASTDLFFNPLTIDTGSVALLQDGYALRPLAVSGDAVRFQLYLPFKEL